MKDMEYWLKKYTKYEYYHDHKYAVDKVSQEYLNCMDRRHKPYPLRVYVHLRLAFIQAVLKTVTPMSYETYYKWYKDREVCMELDRCLNEKK